MRYTLHESRKAVWSQRIALLFLLLFAITFGLHRTGHLQTPVAMKLFGAALFGAVIAVGLAFVGLAGIWREGYTGAGKALAGLLCGVLMLAGPLWSLPDLLAFPRIHEVTTDLDSPPAFQKLAAQRKVEGANSPDFQREAAPLQAKAYPDIKPLPVNRPTEDTYSAVREAVKTLDWTSSRRIRPEDGRPGLIEASDRSKIFGFTDDMVIRVSGVGKAARVDVDPRRAMAAMISAATPACPCAVLRGQDAPQRARSDRDDGEAGRDPRNAGEEGAGEEGARARTGREGGAPPPAAARRRDQPGAADIE